MAEEIKKDEEIVEEKEAETAEEQKEVKEEETKDVSNLTKLIEMTESMEQTKLNIEKVIDEQNYLVEKLDTLKDEKLSKLSTQIKIQTDSLCKQDDKLSVKISKMKEIISVAENDKAYEDFLDAFCSAIGMFAEEFNNSDWLEQFVKGINTNNVQKIADLILAEAIDNNYGLAKDDMTVIIAKIVKKK